MKISKTELIEGCSDTSRKSRHEIKVKFVVKNLYKRHFITNTINIASKKEVSMGASYEDLHKPF
jgi:hypothetical protein